MIAKPAASRLKLFVLLSCAFFAFTIVGTISHEFGHYAVGKFYGGNPAIHYGYTSNVLQDTKEYMLLDSIYQQNEEAFKANLPFPDRQLFEETLERYHLQSVWTMAGGPIQTMLTGTIGLLLLLFATEKKDPDTLTWKAWVFVFLSLFWLRQTTNAMVGFGTWLATGKTSMRSDEINIAKSLDWHPHILEWLTAAIGLGVLAYIVLNVIPLPQRILFLASGLAGGITGYLFWLVYVGPIVMP
jgi:hypothetical protein